MILRPVVSEKAFAMAEDSGVYSFIVPKKSKKLEIAKAVAGQFDVSVDHVRTCMIKGKPKNMIVQRGRFSIKGKRSDLKKAYVKLKEGDSISLFEGSE